MAGLPRINVSYPASCSAEISETAKISASAQPSLMAFAIASVLPVVLAYTITVFAIVYSREKPVKKQAGTFPARSFRAGFSAHFYFIKKFATQT